MFTLAVLALVASGTAVSPVQKVIELCDSLKGKVEADLAAEEKLMGEYSSWFYPLVFDCDKITLDDAGGVSDLPVALSASSAHLDPKCMRLIDAGDALYLWVGTAVPDDALMAVFGVPGPLNPADPPPPAGTIAWLPRELYCLVTVAGLPSMVALGVARLGDRKSVV